MINFYILLPKQPLVYIVLSDRPITLLVSITIMWPISKELASDVIRAKLLTIFLAVNFSNMKVSAMKDCIIMEWQWAYYTAEIKYNIMSLQLPLPSCKL